MSEDGAAPAGPVTAGSLLRQARERQGLHIAALAAAIKVVPKKLELLEADRLDELPDATFARALAQTVCRALKIDAGPILRLLPVPPGHPLANVGEGLNAPFRERPGALVQRDGMAFASSPAFWITAVILVAALAVYLLPSSLFKGAMGGARIASGTEPASAPVDAAPAPPFSPMASMPSDAAAMPAPFASAPEFAASAFPPAGGGASEPTSASVGAIRLQTTAESWIDVTDARGRALLSRVVQPGEALALDGVAPFKVRIGNASGTQLVFHGQPFLLAAYTRDNVARLELK